MKNRYRRELVGRDDRAGYDVGEVAEIAGVPAKTVRTWATTGFFLPSLRDDDELSGVGGYCLGDAVGLRLAAELLELRVQRNIVKVAAGEVPVYVEGGERWMFSYRQVAALDWWLDVPAHPDFFEMLSERYGDVTRIHSDSLGAAHPERLRDDPPPDIEWTDDGDVRKWFDDDGGLLVLLWPLSKRAAEAAARANTVQLRAGWRPSQEMAKWL